MPFLPDPTDALHASPAPPVGYTTCELLGRGGFGSVWRAEGHGGAPCALKFISLTTQIGQPELRSILKMKGIKHVYLVPLHNIWLRDSSGKELKETSAGLPLASAAELVIAMGLGTGTLATLAENYRKRGEAGIPPGELLRYMLQAAEAIDFLNEPRHDLGGGSPTSIHHCDIKPANLLTTYGGVWVCDFGIARFRRPESTGQSLMSMAVMESALTPPYAPPELILNRKDNTHTDQYSLAITYYELRTGRLPFSDEDLKHYFPTFQAHVEGRLDFREVPAAEQAVLRKATSVKQSDRYPSAVEMVEDLYAAAPAAKRPGSSGRIPAMPRTLWAPAEGLEIVPGYRLRRRRDEDGDENEAWSAEIDGGGSATLQIVRTADEDPGPACRAFERLKETSHPGVAEVLGWWLLDAQGKPLADAAGGQARTLVVATRPAGPGRSLLRRLEDVRQDGQWGIPRSELLDYLRQAAEALDHLHAAGRDVQHGDIRPESLHLLYPQGAPKRVVLTRFGSARVLEAGRVAVPKERGGAGTIYRPPETFAGRRLASCDQYGLAVSYYHLRSGRLPRAASRSAFETAAAIQQGLPGLDELPAPEREVIERATDPDPARRFASCLELIEALETCPPLPLPEKAERVAEAAAAGAGTVGRGLVHTILPDFPSDTVGIPSRSVPAPANRPSAAPPETKALITDTDFGQSLVTDSVLLPVLSEATVQPPAPAASAETVVRVGKRKRGVPALAIAVLLGAFVPLACWRFWPAPAPRPAVDPPPARETVTPHIPATGPVAVAEIPAADPDKRKAESGELRTNAAPASLPAETTPKSNGVAANVRREVDAVLNGLATRGNLTAADLGGAEEKLVKLKDTLSRAGAGQQGEEGQAEANRIDAILAPLRSGKKVFADAQAKAAAAAPVDWSGFDRFRSDVRQNLDLAPADKELLKDLPAALKLGLMKQVAAEIGGALTKPPDDWKKTLAKTRWAEADTRVKAARLECLAELRLGGAGSGDDELQQAVKDLDARKKDSAEGVAPYATYAKSLAQFSLVKDVEAARYDDLVLSAKDLAAGNVDADVLRVPHRAGRLRDLLIDAAVSLRERQDLLTPYSAVVAKAAFKMLDTAAGREPLAGPPTAEVEVKLGLHRILAAGALYADSRDPGLRDSIAEWSMQLTPKLDVAGANGRDVFALMLVNAAAQPESAEGRAGRLQSYFRALALAVKESNNIGRKALYDGVLGQAGIVSDADPASLLAAGDPLKQRADLGALYAGVALDVRTHPTDWAAVEQVGATARERSKTVGRLYRKAARLEGECVSRENDEGRKKEHEVRQAGYIVSAASERCLWPDADPAALKKDAEEAIKLAPEYAGGHVIRGFILTREARRLRDFDERVKRLTEVDEGLRKFLARGAADGSSEADLLHRSLSIADVELGNWVRDKEKQRHYLHEAVRLAGLVTRQEYNDYLMLGNACEDVEWILKESGYYQKALDAFNAATRLDREQATGWLSRGRLCFKWANSQAAESAERLRDAEVSLNNALSLADSPPERAEAAYWQAHTLLLRRSQAGANKAQLLGSAEKAYRAGLNASRRGPAASAGLGSVAVLLPDPAPDWAEVILKEWAELDLQESAADRDRLVAAERHAGELEKYSPVDAALFRGQVLVARSTHKAPEARAALEAFDKGLKATPRTQDRNSVRRIHRERLFVWPDVVDKDTLPEAFKDADAAVRLGKECGVGEGELAVSEGWAGLSAYVVWAGGGGDKVKGQALDWFRVAINHDHGDKHHASSYLWRQLAAQMLKVDGSAAEKKEASGYAREAIRLAPPQAAEKLKKVFEDLLSEE
jgi:serine/threonine protein kinase